MLRNIASLLFGLILLLFPAALCAQEGKLASIKVEGSARFTSEKIAYMSGLKPGDEVNRENLQAAADRLAQLGPFRNVRYRFTSRGTDVDVEFQLEDAPAFPVSFDNFPWFTDDELTAAIREVLPFFDGTAPEQGDVLGQMKQALEAKLAARNVKGVVELTLLGRPEGDGMFMQVHLAGPSLRVQGVQFSDPLAGEDKRVRQELGEIVGKAYSRFSVEVFLLEQVRPAYLQRGYLQVKFGRPEARFTGDPNKPLADSVLVLVNVEPGPAYHWGGAEWRGNTAFGPDALNAALGMTLGEMADGNKIQHAFDHARDEYARRGYLEAKVEPEPAFSETQAAGVHLYKVAYRVTVSEGAQYRMGQLVLTGLSPAAEQKLQAAWRLHTGDIFDRVFFDDFLSTLQSNKSAIFGELPIHYDKVGSWLRPNVQAHTVDVLLDFQ